MTSSAGFRRLCVLPDSEARRRGHVEHPLHLPLAAAPDLRQDLLRRPLLLRSQELSSGDAYPGKARLVLSISRLYIEHKLHIFIPVI